MIMGYNMITITIVIVIKILVITMKKKMPAHGLDPEVNLFSEKKY